MKPWQQRLTLAIALLGLAACTPSEPQPAGREDKLVVFAAASLRDAFTALGEEFERLHPGVELTFNFAGTQQLRTQLEHGAAADVFASADRQHMDALLRASHVAAPQVFAHNEPVVVVSSEAGSRIQRFGDLPAASRIVVGAPEVPIGRYTQQILDRASTTMGAEFRARVEARVVSRELNVRQVLMKVSLGEAQAGFVYRSDAQSAHGRVGIVPIPPTLNVMAEYLIATVRDGAHPQLARAWVDFVRSDAGARALSRAGFLAPADPGSSP